MLSPKAVLTLYQGLPGLEGSERLAALVRQTFAACADSRKRCAHLVPLFEEEGATPTLWDVYLTHYRWAGRVRWQGVVEGLLLQDVEGALEEIEAAAPPLRWGMVEEALEASRSLAASHPQAAFALAKGAIQASKTLPTKILGEGCREELMALGFATLANACRVLNRLEAARRAMKEAEARLGDVSLLGVRPAILCFKVSLQMWKRHYTEALRTAEIALRLPASAAVHARLMVQKCDLCITLKSLPAALECATEAGILARQVEDERIRRCALHYRLLLLSEMGRFEEAQNLLAEVRGLLTTGASAADLRKLHWVEARIAKGLDETARANELYAQIHQDFLSHELPFSAAVVTLEWCRLLLKEGRLDEVKRRATEALAEFQRQKVEPEVLSAVALVQEAVLAERLTEEILRRAGRILERR